MEEKHRVWLIPQHSSSILHVYSCTPTCTSSSHIYIPVIKCSAVCSKSVCTNVANHVICPSSSRGLIDWLDRLITFFFPRLTLIPIPSARHINSKAQWWLLKCECLRHWVIEKESPVCVYCVRRASLLSDTHIGFICDRCVCSACDGDIGFARNAPASSPMASFE